MATEQLKSGSVALVKFDDFAQRNLPYSSEEKARLNRSRLIWRGIGLGAAILIPAFLYFAPHLF